MTPFSVSIIVPAHNAAETLTETIASLLCQTTPDWEAIIVDDGSRDETGAIAAQFAAQDNRICVISQSQKGVSAARNAGSRSAQANWLMFFDADDWIAPDYCARMMDRIEQNASLDVVHCGWVRMAPDASLVGEKHPPQAVDLFDILAHYCPFAIHACMVKRFVFERVGGFDTSLITCEDWDLWQRIARQGAYFGGIPEVLAYYRMRSQSLSDNGTQFFIDGLRVLRQGYAPDLRVPAPHPAYKDGLPADKLSSLQFHWAVWPAGLVIGLGQDARPLLQLLNGQAPGLDPDAIASSLFESVLLPTCCPPTNGWQLWNSISSSLQDFLIALEQAAEACGLARRVSIILERMVLENAVDAPLPLQVGRTYGVQLDVTQPLREIAPPPEIERLHGTVTVAGQRIGTLELPVCDGRVSQIVLKDSIADQFCWQILGQFYQETVYCRDAQAEDQENDWRSQHNQIGWTTFLQDLWDRPDWAGEAFYNASRFDAIDETLQLAANSLTLEVSHPFPHVLVADSNLTVILTVGGITFGQFTVPVNEGNISAQALRVAITMAGGLELCRVVVREALLEQPITQVGTLRQRLAMAAQQRMQHIGRIPAVVSPIVSGELKDSAQTLILGHRHQAIGSSGSRWAMLPVAAAESLLAMTQMTQEAIAQTPDPHQPIKQIIYAPDALSYVQSQLAASKNHSNSPALVQTHFNNRDHFETLFATQPDPWKYTTAYEQTKYEQTLSLLPTQKIQRGLELACVEGHFTAQLAPYIGSLMATDISQIAVERAAQRCVQFSHIQFKQLDMAADPLPESLQLIICSEVLYYIGGWQALHNFVQKVVHALEPGGYFLTAHAHLVVDEPDHPGYNWDHPFGAKGISDAFMNAAEMHLVKEIRTPLYRIQLFQKDQPTGIAAQQQAPILVQLPQPTPPPERVGDTILWYGGRPQPSDAAPICTDRLPILMYHRVAPEGCKAMSQWRVTPEAFAEHLHYLRDAGYYTIGMETWQQAIATKTPLPGRAILLTFDDGYLDFFTYAHPLLQAYGFSATVFLVAERVGKSNQWDEIYGESVPLMDWVQIRQLQAQGIEFGSHSTTHRPLTALSVPEGFVTQLPLERDRATWQE